MSETIPDPAQPDPIEPDARFASPAASEATIRRPVPARAILGLVVILLLLAAGGAYYLWQQETARQQAQTTALNDEITTLKGTTARLAARVSALRNRPPSPAEVRVPTALTDKIDGLQQNVNALAATIATDHATIASLQSSVQSKLGALDAKLSTLQSGLGTMPELAARAQRLDRLAAASLALQTGQKLGTIKDAPPALARYATEAPPTEAALRQEFPEAARRAAAAGGDVQAAGSYWQRLKMRVAGLVTVQRHGHVLVGSRASGLLAAAQNDLDDGDLQGAVTTLQALSPQAKAAMQGWLDQANGLLAARQALIRMAGSA